MLEHIIRRPLLEQFHSLIFSNGTGNENQRDLRAMLPGQSQSLVAVKRGQGEIYKNNIVGSLLEPRNKFRFSIHHIHGNLKPSIG